jgi:hypothetical protein
MTTRTINRSSLSVIVRDQKTFKSCSTSVTDVGCLQSTVFGYTMSSDTEAAKQLRVNLEAGKGLWFTSHGVIVSGDFKNKNERSEMILEATKAFIKRETDSKILLRIEADEHARFCDILGFNNLEETSNGLSVGDITTKIVEIPMENERFVRSEEKKVNRPDMRSTLRDIANMQAIISFDISVGDVLDLLKNRLECVKEANLEKLDADLRITDELIEDIMPGSDGVLYRDALLANGNTKRGSNNPTPDPFKIEELAEAFRVYLKIKADNANEKQKKNGGSMQKSRAAASFSATPTKVPKPGFQFRLSVGSTKASEEAVPHFSYTILTDTECPDVSKTTINKTMKDKGKIEGKIISLYDILRLQKAMGVEVNPKYYNPEAETIDESIKAALKYITFVLNFSYTVGSTGGSLSYAVDSVRTLFGLIVHAVGVSSDFAHLYNNDKQTVEERSAVIRAWRDQWYKAVKLEGEIGKYVKMVDDALAIEAYPLTNRAATKKIVPSVVTVGSRPGSKAGTPADKRTAVNDKTLAATDKLDRKNRPSTKKSKVQESDSEEEEKPVKKAAPAKKAAAPAKKSKVQESDSESDDDGAAKAGSAGSSRSPTPDKSVISKKADDFSNKKGGKVSAAGSAAGSAQSSPRGSAESQLRGRTAERASTPTANLGASSKKVAKKSLADSDSDEEEKKSDSEDEKPVAKKPTKKAAAAAPAKKNVVADESSEDEQSEADA